MPSFGGAGRPTRVVVGISGASGVVYGVRLLQILRRVAGVQTHAVITPGARRTAAHELDLSARELDGLADVTHRHSDLGAAISSGSFRTDGMIVAPCSVKTLSAIANSYDDNLLVRAADVTLKERRPLVLLVRETPLHLGHLRLMVRAAEMGATIAPPVPAFYIRPDSVERLVEYTAKRALDLLGLELPDERRWGSPGPAGPEASVAATCLDQGGRSEGELIAAVED
jgi:4-hydroxy-3-polyprenylbenzoate decarboxylase